jgi:hypothetical protein
MILIGVQQVSDLVLSGMQMRVRERDCPVAVGRRDHIAEVALTGAAIVRFSRAGGPALTAMALGSQRRPAPSRALHGTVVTWFATGAPLVFGVRY